VIARNLFLENRLMSYPKILPRLVNTNAVPLEWAQMLWNRAVADSIALVGLTREGTLDWEHVMTRFLESMGCKAHNLPGTGAHSVHAGARNRTITSTVR
jgi:hypothetical protein